MTVTGLSCFMAFPHHSSEYMFYSHVTDEGSGGSGTCGTLAWLGQLESRGSPQVGRSEPSSPQLGGVEGP